MKKAKHIKVYLANIMAGEPKYKADICVLYYTFLVLT